jgi:hypothetical protein
MDEWSALLVPTYDAEFPHWRRDGLTLAQHAVVYAMCGFKLRWASSGAACNPDRLLDFKELRGCSAHSFDKALVDAARAAGRVPPPRPCSSCGAPNVKPRCACNEAYCSRACQTKNWSSHRKICEMVKENNELGFSINTLYWNAVLGPLEQRRRRL